MNIVTKSTISDVHLKRLNDVLKKVNEATAQAIENLEDGQKISLKELTEKVANFLDLSQNQCAPFVTMFVKQHDRCTMVKGRNGGIYKGKTIKKIDDTPKCQSCGQKLKPKHLKNQALAKVSGQKAA